MRFFERRPQPPTVQEPEKSRAAKLTERKKLGDLMTLDQKRVLARKLRVMLQVLREDAATWSDDDYGDRPIPPGVVFEKIRQNNILWKEFVLELAGITEEDFNRLSL